MVSTKIVEGFALESAYERLLARQTVTRLKFMSSEGKFLLVAPQYIARILTPATWLFPSILQLTAELLGRMEDIAEDMS